MACALVLSPSCYNLGEFKWKPRERGFEEGDINIGRERGREHVRLAGGRGGILKNIFHKFSAIPRLDSQHAATLNTQGPNAFFTKLANVNSIATCLVILLISWLATSKKLQQDPPDYLMQLYRATSNNDGRTTASAPYYANQVLAFLDEGKLSKTRFLVISRIFIFIIATI